jgi:hypothetical protein
MFVERRVRIAALSALVLIIVWTTATYLLEGRTRTLQRPEAVGARVAYAVVANIFIGIGGSALVLRAMSGRSTVSTRQAGFHGFTHSVTAVLAGAVLGFAAYVLQGAPSLDPVVVLNLYAQVLVVSVAEVLVCWAVVGSVSESLLRGAGRRLATAIAAIIASLVFGLYHFAHSPPFNSPRLVVLLTVIGLATSSFFFVSRDVYGTIAFHNFLGLYGVTETLERSGGLPAFERPVMPLLLTAAVTIALLITAHRYVASAGKRRGLPRSDPAKPE